MCAGVEEFGYCLSVAFVSVLVGLLLEMLRCGRAGNCVCAEEEFRYCLSVAFASVLMGLLLEMLRCGRAGNCVCV